MSGLNDWLSRQSNANAVDVYRMPLDGSSPRRSAVAGAPIDQFSFLESEDGNLNVLVR